MSNAMETALKKLDTKHSDYILKNVMDTWTEQSNYPVLNVTRDYSNGHVTISQENFSFDEKKWWIPVTYATQAKPYFSNILSIRWLEPRLHNIILDGIDENTGWVIVNLQQTGDYLIHCLYLYFYIFLYILNLWINGLWSIKVYGRRRREKCGN